MVETRRRKNQSIRSILLSAAAGVPAIWMSTGIASSSLYLDLMKKVARTTVEHAVGMTEQVEGDAARAGKRA